MSQKLPKVDMSRWALSSIDVQVLHLPDRAQIEIAAAAQIKNVETNEPGPVIGRKIIDLESVILEPERLEYEIYQQIKNLILHELDECLYIDGKRLCKNPHPEQVILKEP